MAPPPLPDDRLRAPVMPAQRLAWRWADDDPFDVPQAADDLALAGLLGAVRSVARWSWLRLLVVDRPGLPAGATSDHVESEAPRVGGRLQWPLRHGDGPIGTLEGGLAHEPGPDPDDRAARVDASVAPLAAALAELLGARAERAGQEAALQRQQDFVRASSDWTWELDAEHRYIGLSDGFERLSGVPASQHLGHPVVDALLLDELGRPMPDGQRLTDLLARGRPFSRALTRQRLGYRMRYLSRSGVPVTGPDGRVTGWRGTTRDMTERMEIGALAAEREQRLAKLSDQVPGLIFQFRLDASGQASLPFASDRLREMFGIEPPGPALGGPMDRTPWPRLHDEDQKRFARDLQASAQRLAPLVGEYRFRRGDAVRWLETRASPERQADGAVLWHGFAADITDRKETELRLRRSEQQWELAAEANGIGLLSLDFEHGSVWLDQRACAIHGLPCPMPGLRTDDWFAGIDPVDHDEVRAALQRAIAQRKVFERRFHIVRPDGSRRLLEVAARASYGDDELPVALVATCRDVTEQAESDRLRREKETAERANRQKTEFLSRVSHELRTPLNGILGFTQLMALDALHRLAPAQRQRLDRVQAAGRHLLSLIEDMLELTRIEHGAAGLEVVSVDLARALSRALALIEPLAAQHTIGLPGPLAQPCWVRADPRALDQVLMNLLSNAIKYNRRGGTVGLAISQAGHHAVLEVADEGHGLTLQQQAGLFQPFNRLGAEQRRIEGSGLGLVIARELARAMGGELKLARSGPHGSSFRLELPLTDSVPLALPEPEPPPPPMPDTGPRSLLYIEDEPLNVVLMEELVRARPQWTLHVAYDGASGLAQASTLLPDLVLVDMNLPDTHGLALIRRLREQPATAALQCIALSADAMHEQIDRARAAGFDDYWTKPIDITQMLSKLSRVLTVAPKPARATALHG